MYYTFLSFLYHVSVASGLPPDDMHIIRCTVPAARMLPGWYPVIIGADGGSVNDFREWSLLHFIYVRYESEEKMKKILG